MTPLGIALLVAEAAALALDHAQGLHQRVLVVKGLEDRTVHLGGEQRVILVGLQAHELVLAVLDQRENRLVPIEISVLVVGYQRDKQIFQGLPPQPPLSLDVLILGSDADIRAFTKNLDYFRLVLNSPQIPGDEVLVTHLRRAAEVQPPETQRQFLLNAGRELARLLNFDLVRLDNILRRIRPMS